MNADMMKKAKQIGFIALVALGAVFVLNTLANRFSLAKTAQQKIGSGI